MKAHIVQPKGVVLRRNDCPLGPEYAQRAENIDLTQRGWVPWKVPRCVQEFDDNVGTAHVRECCYHGVPMRGARYLDAGVPHRTYLSGPGERPAVTVSLCEPDWCHLGYPRPLAPSVRVRDRGGKANPFTYEARYRLAYSDGCDEVGPASAVSDMVKINPKAKVEIEIPLGLEPMWCATEVVIYRLTPLWDVSKGFVNFEEGALDAGFADIETDSDWVEVGRVPLGDDTFLDDGSFIGPALVTADLLPPVPGLIIVGETTLGSIVGYEGSSLYFSERNAHWGFPPGARHQFPDTICFAAVCLDRIIVVTNSRVYWVVDDADCVDSLQRSVSEDKQSIHCCESTHGVALPDGVIYTTTEGLAFSTFDGSTRIVSRRAFETDDWRSLGPSQMQLGIGHDHLLLSTRQGTYAWPLSFDENGQLPEHLSTLSFKADSWLNDEHGHLYFILDNRLYQFNEGTQYMQMDWWQQEQRLSAKTSVSTMRVDYGDKKLGHANKVVLYRDDKGIKASDRANQTIRMPKTLGDCFSIRMIGTEPSCGMFYAVGKTNITQRQQ